jgi:hypothetical protein
MLKVLIYNQESLTNINLQWHQIIISPFRVPMEKNCSNDSTFGRKYFKCDRFDDHQFHEVDLTNIARLGRQCAESFEVKEEQEFDFNSLTSTQLRL